MLGSEARPTGSFGTGALAAFVATPCAGPFLGAALGTALLLPAAGSVLVFAALGLGLALPFVLVAFVPALRRLLPRPGPWMARLQRFLAIPMAATAVGCLWLLWRQGGAAALAVGLGAVVLLALVLWLAGLRASGVADRAGFAALAAVLAGRRRGGGDRRRSARSRPRACRSAPRRGARRRSGASLPRAGRCSLISPPTGA